MEPRGGGVTHSIPESRDRGLLQRRWATFFSRPSRRPSFPGRLGPRSSRPPLPETAAPRRECARADSLFLAAL